MFDPSWNPDGTRRSSPRRRRIARYLAPLALVAVIVGTYVIVHQGLNTSHASTTVTRTATTPKLTRSQRRYVHDRFYTVRSGESLTSIAARTGVSVRRLQALNRGINPNALQLGQRLRLRR